MPHTCEDCGETFETLSRLRLHDCPGPDIDSERFVERALAELEDGLDRGDILSSFPPDPLPERGLERLQGTPAVTRLVPLLGGMSAGGGMERFAVQLTDRGYVLEHFPNKGWVVVRAVDGTDRTDDELHTALQEAIQEWQSTITELSLEHASGASGMSDKLERELGWK